MQRSQTQADAKASRSSSTGTGWDGPTPLGLFPDRLSITQKLGTSALLGQMTPISLSPGNLGLLVARSAPAGTCSASLSLYTVLPLNSQGLLGAKHSPADTWGSSRREGQYRPTAGPAWRFPEALALALAWLARIPYPEALGITTGRWKWLPSPDCRVSGTMGSGARHTLLVRWQGRGRGSAACPGQEGTPWIL